MNIWPSHAILARTKIRCNIWLVRCWIILGRTWASSKLHLECPHRYPSIARLLWLQRYIWAKLHSQTMSYQGNPCYVWAVMPGVYMKPVYTLLSNCHSQPALSYDCQTRTMVQKVSCRACCQCVQLELSSLSLFFTPTPQSSSSPSRSFSWLSWSTRWHVYSVIVKYLNALI